jgi:hypothetical protein
VEHASGDAVRAAEPLGSVREVPARDGPPDERRRHGTSTGPGDRVDHRHAEAPGGAERLEELHVAHAPAAEAVIVADHELPHAEAGAQDEVDELIGLVRGERAGERDDGDVVQPAVSERLQLLAAGGEQRRCGRRIHHLERMRVEGHQATAQSHGSRALREPGEHVAVATVHAVEGAHRDDGAGDVRREPAVVRQRRRRPVSHAAPRAAASARSRAAPARPCGRWPR